MERAWRMASKSWIWLFSCAALGALLGAAGPRPFAAQAPGGGSPRPDAPAADPLLEMNKEFRRTYARAREDLLARSGPVLVVRGDDLVLIRGGKRTEVRAVPPVYHTLKAVAHVPLTVYVLLASTGDAPIPAGRLAELSAYRRRVAEAGKSLKGRGLSAEVLQRQDKILSASLRFLDKALEAKAVKPGELVELARGVAPLVMANAADAARAQLEGVHKQVRAWRGELTAAEWKSLRVLILGPALPRKGNVMTQYFARLLGERGEGGRILYTEGVFDVPRALDSLGTLLLDTRIGADFFGDEGRMQRDLLADVAQEQLKKMNLDP
jgi:hypothetical protein